MRVFVHDDFWTHWKLQRAALRLKMDQTHVGGAIVRLWCWTMRYRSEGDLSGLDDAEVALAAGVGDVRDFTPTLREVGFIDAESHVHDWLFWQGTLLSKVNRDKERRANKAQASRSRRANVAPALRPTSVAVPTPVSTPTPAPVAVEELAPAGGPGWSPNRDAQHIAQRWSQINAKGLCAPDKASQHFQAGLDAGIDKHALMASVEANRGRKPFEIVDALKAPMTKKRKGGMVLDLSGDTHAQD